MKINYKFNVDNIFFVIKLRKDRILPNAQQKLGRAVFPPYP